MNILYIGAFCVKSLIDKYPDKGLDAYKTSEFLINGVRHIEDVRLDVITAPDTPSFPKMPWKYDREEDVSNQITSVRCINLPGIKQFSISHSLINEASKIIRRNQGKTYVMIPYMVYHHVRVAKHLKQRFGNQIVICQIIPDIFHVPDMLSVGYWMNRYAEHNAAKSDSFVLFTRAMAEYLHIPDERYMVMESLIDGDAYITQEKNHNTSDDKMHVLYTGALSNEHGVMKLVEMMRLMIRDDFELWITGRGPLADTLSAAAQQDNRIRFFGTVPKEEVFLRQAMADILINPRADSDSPELTKYMFPSKLMEYMLTGNPTVICHMSGIPEDYYNYVFTAEDDTPAALAKRLNEVLDMSVEERHARGQAARQYILDNKTIPVQSRRIVDFLKKF